MVDNNDESNSILKLLYSILGIYIGNFVTKHDELENFLICLNENLTKKLDQIKGDQFLRVFSLWNKISLENTQ